jgi:hypothetical protein
VVGSDIIHLPFLSKRDTVPPRHIKPLVAGYRTYVMILT